MSPPEPQTLSANGLNYMTQFREVQEAAERRTKKLEWTKLLIPKCSCVFVGFHLKDVDYCEKGRMKCSEVAGGRSH